MAEHDDKVDKDDVEVKISFKLNRRMIERAIWIVAVLILLLLVFYNPFCKTKCEKGVSGASETAENETDNISEEPVIEEETTVEEEPEEEETPLPEPETENELSGKITLGIGEIKIYENNTKVEFITVSIDNQKKIFTPELYVYWYDETTEEAVKLKPNGGRINITGPIALGTVKQIKLDDELVNKRLRVDDPSKETFKVELLDRNDPEVIIETKTKTIRTD